MFAKNNHTMKNKIVILGVGYKSNIYFSPSENIFLSKNAKVNIGAACAKKLAEGGNDLIIISKTPAKINKVRADLLELFPKRIIDAEVIDILNSQDVNDFFCKLSKECNYNYVHSAGLGAGGYRIKDDNPYLALEDIPIDLPTKEFEVVVKSLLAFVRGFLPFFRNQVKSKVVVINSMSGIRPYPLGFSHSSAKAGLHNAVRSLTLELNKENVFFSEVNPGMADTGFYDGEAVIDAVQKISKEFGYNYDELPQMSPYEVADAVKLCLESKAHILEINLVSEGQFPHCGA